MAARLKSLVLTLTLSLILIAVCCMSVSADSLSGDATVVLNGKTLEFQTDSLPRNVNGRIMVPYRAIFEELNLTVGYDAATGVISGRADDFVLKMKNADPVIKLEYDDGTTQTREMDVAPYIVNGRTFVATRFVSEMLGYSVGWDGSKKQVIIINPCSIVSDAEVADAFSILSKLESLNTDPKKNYSAEGSFSAAMDSDKSLSMNGEFSGIVADNSEELKLCLLINDELQNANVKYNSVQGTVYIKTEKKTDNTQWIKLNLSELLGSDSEGMKNLFTQTGAGSFDAQSMILDLINASDNTLNADSYTEMKKAYAQVKKMLGDDSFSKIGDTYHASFDGKAGELRIVGNIDITVNAEGEATGYAMDIEMKDSATTMKLDSKNSGLTSDVKLCMEKTDGKKIETEIVTKLKETESKPDISIPKGEKVTDVTDLIGSLM